MENVSWQTLLNEALSKPGMIHDAYSRFHNYSMGNQILAMWQCGMRGIEPGPLGTFPHWKENGRHVRKGERAITLCMPVTGKRTEHVTADDGTEQEIEHGYTRFVYRNHWFVLSQTDGEPYQPSNAPNWDKSKALNALSVTETSFDVMNGNVQGFARRREISVSPIAALPHKTTFHELAHVVLGHTTESDMNDSERTPKSEREVEAEAVALICCESLGLPGAEFARGYIQSWGTAISERSAQKIFRAADAILKAGVN